jgi:hypothetical protein
MIEMKFLALFSLSSPPPSSPLPFSLSPFPLLLLFRHYSAKIACCGNELTVVEYLRGILANGNTYLLNTPSF